MTVNLGDRVDWVATLGIKRGGRENQVLVERGRGGVGRLSSVLVLLSLRCHGIQKTEANGNLELWGKKWGLQHRFVCSSI